MLITRHPNFRCMKEAENIIEDYFVDPSDIELCALNSCHLNNPDPEEGLVPFIENAKIFLLGELESETVFFACFKRIFFIVIAGIKVSTTDTFPLLVGTKPQDSHLTSALRSWNL